MASQVPGGSLVCPMCDRALPRSEYATDGWRERMGKNPGRCLDCERELGRAKTAISPTGRYADADHSAAYWMAMEVCQAHGWGTGYYSEDDRRRAVEKSAVVKSERAAADRRRDEDRLRETAERDRAWRDRELDRAAAARAAKPSAETPVADLEAEERKRRIREWRKVNR